MSEEERFDWRVTVKVGLPSSQFAERTVELKGTLAAPAGDAPDFGIEALRRAVEEAAKQMRR